MIAASMSPLRLRRLSPALLLALALPAPGAGAADRLAQITCSPSPVAQDFPLPAGVDRDRLVRELHPHPFVANQEEVEKTCAVMVRPWKAKPGHAIVVLETARFTADGYGDPQRLIHLGLYPWPLTANARALAKTATPTALEPGSELSLLDFAPYRIAPDTIAFGLRTRRNIPYSGGGGENVTLYLYRVVDATIDPILTTLMKSSSITAGDWNEDGTRDHFENGSDVAAVLSVLKKATRGFFDLRKSLEGRSMVFRWDGAAYQAKGADPVKDVND
jgi:hypothetical protein